MLSNTSCYILKISDKLCCIYYDKYDGICYKEYKNNHWTNPYIIYKFGSQNFTVTLSNTQQIYLFCQDQKGSIILCNFNGNKWKNKILKDNKSNRVYNIDFHAVVNNNNINLIYNLPDESEKKHYLINTNLSNDGMWSTPEIIDEIAPFNSSAYIVQKIIDDHYILFYQIRRRENILGYREVLATQNKFSDFKIIHNSVYQISDISFLTTSNTIHTLYVVLSLFSYRLVYKKKHGNEFSSAITIFESQRIENTLMFILENQIWITFYSNGVLFTSTSSDNGNSFSRAQRYYGHMLDNKPMKAFYLTDTEQKEDEIFLSTLYTSQDYNTDILLIPELYPNFYPRHIKENNQSKPQNYLPNNYQESEERINVLNNKLSQKIAEINEKDKQLLELTQLLKERNEYISLIESKLRNRFKDSKDLNKEPRNNKLDNKLDNKLEKKEFSDNTIDNINK